MLGISVIITILQMFVKPGKRQWYKDFVLNYMRPQ
jgi:hypothetical protein